MLFVASCLLLAAGAADDLVVELPEGTTPFGIVGLYRVEYQAYGKDAVEMPPSWTGHFAEPSGISYVQNERILDRNAALLHCPWRNGTGRLSVDYRLKLPGATPVALSFGIAMRPDVATHDKSDGVEFSCCLNDGTADRELMRKHWDKAEWLDFDFDLSEYAGKIVTVRFQTEPGPAKNASWDYSYFGDAKIVCGASAASQSPDLKTLLEAPAYLATAYVDLRAAANAPGSGVTPSNLLPCKNAVSQDGDAFLLTYEAADIHMAYRYVPATGTLDDIAVQVGGDPAFRPAAGGGAMAVVKRDGGEDVLPARGGKLLEIEAIPGENAIRAVWEYGVAGEPFAIAWRFGIVGKALTVEAQCEQPVLAGLTLGQAAAAFRTSFGVPYLVGSVEHLSAARLFACRYLDWTQSHASQCPQGQATYEPKTDGARNPFFEKGYIAVSPSVHEVLPNLPHPPSPYLDVLGPRIMLDMWGHHKDTYQGDAENLRNLKDNGVDHLAIISHVWQCYGYDVKLPDHLPANPAFGGDEGMIEFGKAANECGYVWSLHENYIDLYPDAPSYDPEARVLRADGSPSPAWYNAGTKVQSFGLKCTRALGYAQQNSPEIHNRFATNAAYLDVHTCVPPWHQLDHDAREPMAAMALLKVQRDTELFQFMRDTHGGPLFGEGCNHFYWAGRCDGVEAQVAGGEDHAPFLDFDLLKLHPQMVNHGMGYYERWFRRGYDHQWGNDTGTPEQIDKYRAQEIAYGHAGFIGNAQTDNIQWVAKEHHLMHAVQRLTGTAKVCNIFYEIDGQWATAGVALALNRRLHQRIEYDAGTTVYVNWDAAPWEVADRILPQWGFFVKGRQTAVCTELRDGKYADYAECPEYVFADARTAFTMPYRNAAVDIEPRLKSFEYLGENKIRLAYEWIVNDTLQEDQHCFVHFVNSAGRDVTGIEFQQDHDLPKPANQWQPGEVVDDGPYEIAVPEEGFPTYDIVIGLFAGARIRLKGPTRDDCRVLIGRLDVTRENGHVANVALAPLDEVLAQIKRLEADFDAHMNPKDTWVDYGNVATNGSVKINKEPGRLVLFPYPRGREFDVAIDPAKFDPKINLRRIRLYAQAAGATDDLGDVPYTEAQGRIFFKTAVPNAGRYILEWPGASVGRD